MKFVTLLLLLLMSGSFVFSQSLTANFTASKTAVCEGESITFTSTSTGSNITTYNWNFGNGETSTQQNPVYTYPSPGTYTVTLAIQNSTGQADAEVKVGYITINPSPQPSFSMSGNSCTVPINITFNNTSSPTADVNFAWSFGNGSTSTSLQPAAVTYNNAGTYTVTLKATSTVNGCSKTYSHDINISNFQADFTAPAIVCVGSPVQFTDNSSAGANVWLWNADIAGASTVQNPTFVFSTPGTYTVSLSARNTTSGCDATATKTVQVVAATVPNFMTPDTAGCSPATITFQNTTGASGTYKWVFGDGTTFTGTTPPAHTYTGNGTYNVKLIVTDANGCVDSLTKNSYIVISDIEAKFMAVPVDGCTPLQVNFINQSTTPNSTTSPITAWSWTFGNGQTSTSATPPVQTYVTGKYDVTLIITTANGCKDTIYKQEYIKVGTKQHAGFTYAPLISCAKKEIVFTNTSVIDPNIDSTEVRWDWDFGDDKNSTDKNPKHQYDKDTGYFDVQLIVDYRGCKDTMKVDSAVYIKAPISQYYLQQDLFCNPSFPITVQTVDTSKLGVSTDLIDVYWKWGDGTQTHIPNADLHDSDKSSTSHQYPAGYGSYTIWHIIENHTTGCVDSLSKVVNVSSLVPAMTLTNDSICKNGQIGIDGSAATSSNTITSWGYNMGNGVTKTGNPVSYTYTTAGTYTITQTVKNSVGCVATTTLPVVVLQLPLADFTLSLNAGCAPLITTAVNNSSVQGNGAPLSYFEWTNLETGAQQTTHNLSDSPTFTFLSAGTHEASLIVTDVFGCKSAPVKQQVNITKPTAGFTVDPVVCNAADFSAQNSSSGTPALSYQWKVDNIAVGTQDDLTHQFNDNSTGLSVNHTVTLIVTDGNGCKDTLTKPVTVSTPKASFTYIATGASVNGDGTFNCPPVFVNFADHSTSIGNITGWQWDFYDNGNSSTNQNPSNTFVFSGIYSTSLTVTDEYGCTADTILLNYLRIGGPQADPSYVQSLDKCGQVVTFSLGTNSEVASIDWDLGNGDHLMDTNNAAYSYLTSGTYSPKVTITDAVGCQVIYELDPLTITPNGLTAYFTYSPTEIKIGNTVTFIDGSSYTLSPITKWEWHIYDNVYTNPTNASVTQYMGMPGYQDVTLIVTDQQGCQAEYTTKIFVDPSIQIPNVFTPNGDGINDYVLLNYDFYKEYEIFILNRWGNVVYENRHQQGLILWDGKAQNGEFCTDGVYFYKFKGLLLDEITEVQADGFVHLFGQK